MGEDGGKGKNLRGRRGKGKIRVRGIEKSGRRRRENWSERGTGEGEEKRGSGEGGCRNNRSGPLLFYCTTTVGGSLSSSMWLLSSSAIPGACPISISEKRFLLLRFSR